MATAISRAEPEGSPISGTSASQIIEQNQQVIEEDNLVTWKNGVAKFHTRHGTVEILQNKIITFEQGLLGVNDGQEFCLAEIPNPKFRRFRILQSATKKDLSFIVMPAAVEEGKAQPSIYELEHWEKCCEELNVHPKEVVVLWVTCVHTHVTKDPKRRISVNLRAPILINSATRQGWQYVFNNTNYEIRSYLDLSVIS